jgi:lysophospholipase L1-like esterase
MSLIDICVFGDSIGKGIVLQPETSRYKVIKMNLEKIFGLEEINIKNYSMFGCTVSKGLSNIKRHATELTKYKNVFLELGGNDCDFNWKEIAENPEKEHLPKTPIIEFRRVYENLIEEIRSNGGSPIMINLPPIDPKRYFNWISKGLNKRGLLQWLGDINMIYRWQEMYNVEVMLLATKMGVPIIDIRSAFLKYNNYNEFLCFDGIHPNNDGYELIYKTIGEQYMFTMGY